MQNEGIEQIEQNCIFDEQDYYFTNLHMMEMKELAIYLKKSLVELENLQKILFSLLDFPGYIHLEIFDFDIKKIESLLVSYKSKYAIKKLKIDTYYLEVKINDYGLFIEMLKYMEAYAGYGMLNFYSNCNICFNKEIINENLKFTLVDSSNFVLVSIKDDGESLSIISEKENLKKFKEQLECF